MERTLGLPTTQPGEQMDWCGWQNGGKEDSGWFTNPLGGGAIGEIFVKRFGEFRDEDPTFVSRIRISEFGVKSMLPPHRASRKSDQSTV